MSSLMIVVGLVTQSHSSGCIFWQFGLKVLETLSWLMAVVRQRPPVHLQRKGSIFLECVATTTHSRSISSKVMYLFILIFHLKMLQFFRSYLLLLTLADPNSPGSSGSGVLISMSSHRPLLLCHQNLSGLIGLISWCWLSYSVGFWCRKQTVLNWTLWTECYLLGAPQIKMGS